MFQTIKKKIVSSGLVNNQHIKKIYTTLKKVESGFSYLKSRNKWVSSSVSEIIDSSFTYDDLDHLRIWNPTLFAEIFGKICEYNINQLKKKTNISVGFLIFTSSMWNCEEIYRLFENDTCFNPIIFVRTAYEQRPITQYSIYQSTMRYFKMNNYNVVGIAEEFCDKKSEMIDIPDIIFHQLPYKTNSSLCIKNLPLSVLNVYIPYSMSVDAEQQNRYNTLGYQMSWKVFCETKFDLEFYQKHANNKGLNGIFLGYPKMDVFYQNESSIQPSDIWKIPNGFDINEITKIIYAPHHSIGKNTIQFSTFDQNYMIIYEYAKKHPDTTTWIIKPHPSLKYQSIIDGIFKDETEFDEYIHKWNALPNARAVVDGPYFDMFKTSDGMIVDSVSFLSEYQYLGKPLLFLTRPEQKFTPYGNQLISTLYTALGSDSLAIVTFIESVLIKKEDPMRIQRAEFFKEYLDYKHQKSNLSASEAIYRHIKSALK